MGVLELGILLGLVGFSVGYAEGVLVGFANGGVEGALSGDIDGEAWGDVEGTRVGSELGVDVGHCVGARVGVRLGERVGTFSGHDWLMGNHEAGTCVCNVNVVAGNDVGVGIVDKGTLLMEKTSERIFC